jgi:hypothetical protein
LAKREVKICGKLKIAKENVQKRQENKIGTGKGIEIKMKGKGN